MAETEFLSGKREIISIGKESTYGTAVNPTIILGNNATWTPNNENSWLDNRGAGTGSTTQTYEISNKIVRGTLKFVPQDWMMLVFAIGQTTNTGSAPTVHTFSRKTGYTIPSFTLERKINATTDSVRTYDGCQCNRFTLEWNAGGSGAGGTGQYVFASMDVFARDITPGTTGAGSPTNPNLAGFQARNVTLTLNSSAKTHCIRGNIVIDTHLNDGRFSYYSSSSALKGESQMQLTTYSGEFTLHYTDNTEIDFWNNRVVVPGTNTLVFNRATDDNLTCTFTNLRIIAASDPTNLDGFNMITLRWVADDITFVANDINDQTYIT